MKNEIELTFKCRAWDGDPVRAHMIRVCYGLTTTIQVWDPIGQHFTTCHRISKHAIGRILAEAHKLR
jgi:hypothetical protein